MKVVILAGGYGTRISEESILKPKPMIEVGGMPILWHIMKIYSSFGHNEFYICAGYKQNLIKEWFSKYLLYKNDISIDFSKPGLMTYLNNNSEPWKVNIIDTGLDTMTGGRIKRIKHFIGDETFLMTYGDAISDINIKDLIDFHYHHNKLTTITAINPTGRFGYLDLDNNSVKSFREKSKEDVGFINAGFMVLEPKVIDLIKDDKTIFEKEPMQKLAEQNQMVAFKHTKYWQCMDTLRDKEKIELFLSKENPAWLKG